MRNVESPHSKTDCSVGPDSTCSLASGRLLASMTGLLWLVFATANVEVQADGASAEAHRLPHRVQAKDVSDSTNAKRQQTHFTTTIHTNEVPAEAGLVFEDDSSDTLQRTPNHSAPAPGVQTALPDCLLVLGPVEVDPAMVIAARGDVEFTLPCIEPQIRLERR